MTPFRDKDILDTFRIVIDTREQMTPRAQHRIKAFGVPCERATLSYGDYAGNVTLPGGALLDTSVTITPKCVIERKMSLDELAACLGRERRRFERELIRASEAGAKIFLLIEDGSWEKILRHQYRSKLNENAYIGSLTAFQFRYGVHVIFCTQLTTPRVIREILYRDIKERLENGEFRTEE